MNTVFGHEFRPMTAQDYYGFAGASEGAMICETDTAIMIYEPDQQLSIISGAGEMRIDLARYGEFERRYFGEGRPLSEAEMAEFRELVNQVESVRK